MSMSILRRMPTVAIESPAPFIPVYSPEERARRRQRVRELLASWMRDGDEQEQRETMAVLREALGEKRTLSGRPLFP
jgi:hypothetical protein